MEKMKDELKLNIGQKNFDKIHSFASTAKSMFERGKNHDLRREAHIEKGANDMELSPDIMK